MRTNLAASSSDAGDMRDLFVGAERRYVVIKEAPANIDCATGTPMYNNPDKYSVEHKRILEIKYPLTSHLLRCQEGEFQRIPHWRQLC